MNAAGFSGVETRDIVLQVGQNVDLNVKLTVAQSTDSRRSLSRRAVGGRYQDRRVPGDRLEADHRSPYQRTPCRFIRPAHAGVTNDGTFGLLSFRGVAGHNAFLIDGNDTTEQFYNENAGRTRIASQISQDAVEEFQVVSTNMSAAYGRAMGGVVNHRDEER